MRNQELVDKAKAGHPGAFEELYYAYINRVQRQIYNIVGPDRDVEDLIQQTFIRAYRNLASFRGDASFSTWIQRIAINVGLTHLRKRKRWFNVREDLVAHAPESNSPAATARSPERVVIHNDRATFLHEVLDKLKPKKRAVFVLYEIEGHTLEEIAELVEAPLYTVAGRLRSARQQVRRAIEQRKKADNRFTVRRIA